MGVYIDMRISPFKIRDLVHIIHSHVEKHSDEQSIVDEMNARLPKDILNQIDATNKA